MDNLMNYHKHKFRQKRRNQYYCVHCDRKWYGVNGALRVVVTNPNTMLRVIDTGRPGMAAYQLYVVHREHGPVYLRPHATNNKKGNGNA